MHRADFFVKISPSLQLQKTGPGKTMYVLFYKKTEQKLPM
jgi:hypothetical protein